MLAVLILTTVLGQTPQAQWYPITNRPGWEGWGVPTGSELIPEKWRKTSKPETEWVLETKAVQVEEVKEWMPTVKEKKDSTAPAQPPAQQPAAVISALDPYGFTIWLNNTRAAYGLSAVGYDPNLSNWAAANNNQQANRGMGHYVMGPARRQNAAWGSVNNIGSMWMNSPGHRSATLDPTIRWIGIAGLGAYWTMNAN